MSILVVGSVAFDDVTSPSGSVKNILGGRRHLLFARRQLFHRKSASSPSSEKISAPSRKKSSSEHRIDTRGIERAKGKTFRWGGSYADNLNEAKTDYTDLNVFETFQPRIPKEYEDSDFLFLANIQPTLQADVRRKMNGVRLTGCDTMNYWINGTPEELAETLKLVNVLLDQRHRSEDARARNQPAARRAKSSGHGPAGAGHQARRIWRHHFLSRRRVRNRHVIPSAPPLCRSKK